MIYPQGAGPVIVERMEAHRSAIRRFMQWIMSQEELGVTNRVRISSLIFQQTNQPLQRLQVLLSQPFPFRQEPFIVAGRQQIAVVERARRFQLLDNYRCDTGLRRTVSSGKRFLQRGDIQRKGCRRVPLRCLRVGTQKAICLG
jgi:hypothetical protein